MDKIILPEICVTACHGVYATEKHTPQPFRISVELGLDLHPAALSDEVADTIHYGELYQQIVSFVEQNSFNLIEKLAEQLALLALADPRVEYARVSVEKSRACHNGLVFPAVVSVERVRK